MFAAALSTFLLASVATSGTIPQDPVRKNTVTGELRLHGNFPSAILGRSRTLRVWLPPGYEAEPNRRYPVLYMGDGQNLFNLETSFLPDQEWRVDETATALIKAKLIEPVIVVGIDNAGMDRANEYLPTRVNNNGGKVADFGRALVEEIKPMIDRTYRTKTGAQNTAVAGSSLGGLMALHVGFQYPKVFGKLGAISPSVWWDDRQVLKAVDALPRATGQQIWTDIGSEEGPGAEPNTVALKERLVAKGWKEGKNLAFYLDLGAKHNERAWANRMGPILMWFFPNR